MNNLVRLSGQAASLLDVFEGAAQSGLKSFPVERLEQVIDCVDLEGPQCKSIVRGHENDGWHPLALDLLKADTKARVAFVDKIAAPVLNKMFECRMIP